MMAPSFSSEEDDILVEIHLLIACQLFILYFALFCNDLLHIFNVLLWFIASFAFICNSLLHILHCHAIVFTNLPAHPSDRSPLPF